MKWKNLSIGRKLGIGFGSVLVLLAGISLYTYLGFHKVDHLAHETDEMSQNNTFMLQKLIDHLNWVSPLSNLVFKEDVHSVNLESDDHKCAFGKWLYSSETKALASKDKEIGQLIEAIKEPHHRLHQSAIKIKETYVNFDRALDAMLADRWIDAVTLAQTVSTRVGELGRAALDVGKVTETISEISEQTNLLALNATIEAARAGEAGKGFAVVPNEIKELAKQTAAATLDIRQRLEGIQGSTKGTVGEINKIEPVIFDINEIVTTIATAIEEQSASTKEISGNVNQAARGIEDVNENIAQSSTVAGSIARDVVEENDAAREMAGGSTQVNTSAGELSRLSENLRLMLAQFAI